MEQKTYALHIISYFKNLSKILDYENQIISQNDFGAK